MGTHGKKHIPGKYYRELLCKERIILEEHCDSCGCDLVIDPWIKLTKYGKEARRVRLTTLKKFLESKKCTNIGVVCSPKIKENLLIVGDWFYAQSITPDKRGIGYRQTNFTWHAPSVLYMKRKFENEFEYYLEEYGGDRESSCTKTIEVIKKIISSI
jgi:hypothetical protein